MFHSPAQRSNRRKLAVFAGVFAVLMVGGMVYNFSRPAIYLASTRLRINPGSVQVESVVATGGTQGTNATRSLQSELQVLTSRPLLESATAQLSPALQAAATTGGSDYVSALQAGLEVRVANGTDVVMLSFHGAHSELAAGLVNGLVLAYMERLEKDYQATSGDSIAQNQEEVERLQQRVATKRGQIEEFRLRHNIVSLEREENAMLGQIKGQTEALNRAQERVAVAEGKVRSAKQTVAIARPVSPTQAPRVNPTLASMEHRASVLREELIELNRQFTKAYLDMDPKSRSIRDRLAELERQIAQQEKIGSQTEANEQQVARNTSLTAAEEELTAARDAVERLQAQATSNRGMVQQFTARFNEYRSLSAELVPIEALLRDATQRKARLEAGERGRRPSVKVLEPAVAPIEPWQPQYTRDAGLVLGSSLVLALLAMWMVELFNKQDVQPTMVVAQNMPRPAFEPGHYPDLALAGPGNASLSIGARRALATPQRHELLAAPASSPRELSDQEVAALLDNCVPAARLFSHLMLRGLTAEESLGLKAVNLAPSIKGITVEGRAARTLSLDAGFFDYLAAIAAPDGRGLVAALGEKNLTTEEMEVQLLYAAHDAALDEPSEVTPEALRHTCAAHLARQGIRLSELAKLMGPLDAAQARILSAMAPAGRRLNLDEVEHMVAAAVWPSS